MKITVDFYPGEDEVAIVVGDMIAKGSVPSKITMRAVKTTLADIYKGYGNQWSCADDVGLEEPDDEDFEKVERVVARLTGGNK